ncbi:hypothetical protein AURDEDRAFT_183399 [Auricularia subglabra TFB-10046 SS5]|nr:hypothetical protein AURDEDRAFT_183399 [Auricularia subglabra TFB-10046 SS5]
MSPAPTRADLYSEAYAESGPKPGTPMFAAIEISSPFAHGTGYFSVDVLTRLEAVNELQEFRERAFPGNENKFMSLVYRVDSLVTERCTKPAIYTDPLASHRPWHDVESFFWVLYWAFLRASPLLRIWQPAGFDADYSFSQTATYLVQQDIVETNRALYRLSPPTRGLHPLLSKIGPLMEDLANYPTLPWQNYESRVPGVTPNHAHVAFQRMLLVEISRLANTPTDNILLDPERPRVVGRIDTSNFPNYGLNGPLHGAGTSAVASGTLRHAMWLTASGHCLKRKATDGDFEGADNHHCRPTQRAKTMSRPRPLWNAAPSMTG